MTPECKTRVDKAYELLVENDELNNRIESYELLGEETPEQLILEAERTAQEYRDLDKLLTTEEVCELFYRMENYWQSKYQDDWERCFPEQ